MQEECPICFDNLLLYTVKPCNHRFCTMCINALLRKHAECPICRQIYFTCLPPLVNYDGMANVLRIVLKKNENEEYGMILRTEKDVVYVKSVEKNSVADLAGIQVNFFILAINNIPCNSRKSAVEILLSNAENIVYMTDDMSLQ